ncbi:MAG: 2'-5' RNA ligase family protein [Chloroflexota bacterium]
MHGLVSLLPPPYYQQVEALWQELADEHHLQGIRVTPYPHFSWQIAQSYQFDDLEEILQQIALTTAPIVIRTTGIGIFTGPRPVIFIPVVKNAGLVNLHQEIWAHTQPVSQGLSPYYAPSHWVPHISLAYEDVDQNNIMALMQKLAFRTFNWEMTIDNFALIYEPDGQIGALSAKIQFVEK